MILDILSNAARYTGFKTGLSEGFGFLDQPGLAKLADGKYEINGDHVFALVQRVPGRKATEGELEGHRKYIDIQYVISGNESMGWSPREGLVNSVEYHEGKDVEFFEGAPQSIIHVPPGFFTLFLPTDAHLPCIGDGPIHKVVIKVAVG